MDKNTVYKIARLARLKVADSEADMFAAQLSNILNWVEQLGEVNTDNVKPLANVVDIAPKMRADIVNDGGIQQDVLANAPEDQQGYFVVPKVVE
jgi:aspartyl-tRNA(Asn)/glutamyl-tRNA(Gln) amidotransferase subunit C